MFVYSSTLNSAFIAFEWILLICHFDGPSSKNVMKPTSALNQLTTHMIFRGENDIVKSIIQWEILCDKFTSTYHVFTNSCYFVHGKNWYLSRGGVFGNNISKFIDTLIDKWHILLNLYYMANKYGVHVGIFNRFIIHY